MYRIRPRKVTKVHHLFTMRLSSPVCRYCQSLLERIHVPSEVRTIPRASKRVYSVERTQSSSQSARFGNRTSILHTVKKVTGTKVEERLPSDEAVNLLSMDRKVHSKPSSAQDGVNSNETHGYHFKQQAVPSSLTPGSPDMSTPQTFDVFSTPKPPANSQSMDEPDELPESMEEPDERILPSTKVHPKRPITELDPEACAALSEFLNLVNLQFPKLRDKSPSLPIEEIFSKYYQLPQPRVCYIHRSTLRLLFRILDRQDSAMNSTAQRYIDVINDLLANGTTVRRIEWCGALNSLGKSYKFEKHARMDIALKATSDMENFGIQADVGMLASLLQSAVSEGNTKVARQIEAVIKERNLGNNIVIWTERIRVAGKDGDASKVYKLFQEFCETGVPVDIVFVNAVLQAFLNAKQLETAEMLYWKLRTLARATIAKSPHQSIIPFHLVRQERKAFLRRPKTLAFREKEIEAEFKKRGVGPEDLLNEDGSPNEQYKEILSVVGIRSLSFQSMLIPNHGTLRLLIAYHCHDSGSLDDVVFYLNEMDVFSVAPQYGNYADILHGFFKWHSPNSPWSADRLEKVFSYIRGGIEGWDPPFPITYVIALTAIRAFGKVYGGQKAREVWELLRPWLVINENVEHLKPIKVGYLEDLVVAFEEGGQLSAEMAGEDIRYKVFDWRNA